jgi:hypothetical protein
MSWDDVNHCSRWYDIELRNEFSVIGSIFLVVFDVKPKSQKPMLLLTSKCLT